MMTIFDYIPPAGNGHPATRRALAILRARRAERRAARGETADLALWDDRMLADIGVTRADLRRASGRRVGISRALVRRESGAA